MDKRICILGTYIDVLTMKQTLKKVDKFIALGKPLHLVGVNADKINQLGIDADLKKIVNSCDIINADGASIVLASKYLNCPLPERVAGIDLMQNLVSLCEKKNYSIYLLGAKQEVVEKTKMELKKKHPNLIIAGIHNGYFTDEEWDEIYRILMEKAPKVVFVGITSPKKEYLVDYLQKKGLSCVFMGVGGSFDVISGNIPRAPRWIQKINMEWLFRVIQEPKRLLKRYLLGNIKFINEVRKAKKGIGH